MKTIKILLAGFVLMTLMSCDKLAKITGQGSNADSELEGQMQQQEVEQMSEMLKTVAMSLDSIQEQEEIITRFDENTPRNEILERLEMFKIILDRKKAEIDLLTAEAMSNQGTIADLKKVLEYLNQQLEEKSARIAKLEEAVRNKDAKIAELRDEVDELTVETGVLKVKNQQQEKQLNQGFYIVGTKKELKNLGLLSGGLLSKKRANYSNIDNSVFKKVDVRNFHSLVIDSKSPKLLTEKPASSYTLTKNGDGTTTLKITNTQEFWGASPYLIIMQ